ncbi:MAG: hypothetical protein M5R36_06710 [Deltaproteobacteria bacterium]|nr:hypothetical protein [Deltaproteobacteria bacterium]
MNAKSVLSAALAAAGVAAVAALFYFLARGAVEKDPNRPASSPRPETTAVYRAGYSRRLLEKNGTCVAAEVTRTNPYRVTECTALGKGWPCTRDAGECTDGYRAFSRPRGRRCRPADAG